jgi:hypothetical protein
MKIELSESELRIIKWLASQRSSLARKNNITDAKIGPQDSEEIDIDGLIGEFAFAKLFNLWPDMEVGHRPLHDVVCALGGVDVKTTRREGGRLLASLKKKSIPSDWYALMWIENDHTVHFRGAVMASTLFDDENIADLGHGRGYVMHQIDLTPPDSFKYHLERA